MADIISTKAAAQAAGTSPVVRPPAGCIYAEHETIEVGSAQSSSDTLDFFYLPGDALIVGGHLMLDNLDTNSTETLDIDVGWTATGGASADPDGLINGGVMGGDELIVGGIVRNFRPLDGLLVTNGVIDIGGDLGGKTLIQGVVNAPAATGGTGTITLTVYYKVP